MFAFLAATAASPQVRETLDVEVIEVPAYVMAPDGTAIRGLPGSAFHLFVDGREQPLEYFDEVSYGTRASSKALAGPRPRRERRLYLLLFDFNYAQPGHLERARRAAENLIAQSVEATDAFSVAKYSALQGVQLITPFLTDRAAVRRAIETLDVSGANDPLGIAITTAERTQWTPEDSVADTGFVPGNRGDEADAAMAQAVRGGTAHQESHAEPYISRTKDLFFNLGGLALRLEDLEGQKHVVYLTDGIQTLDPRNANQLRELNDMFASFRAANVFLDAVDISGLRHKVLEDAGPHPGKFFDSANWNINAMTSGTGGVFVHNVSDLSAALRKLTAGHESLYILGFRRASKSAGRIAVKVSDVPRGTRVSYRQGFGEAKPRSSVDPIALADILVNDVAQNGVDVDLDVSPRSIVLTVPRDQVMSQVTPKDSFITAFIYVFADDGSVVKSAQQRIVLEDGAVRLALDLDLEPGTYVAKAVVHVGNSPSLGFARTTFSVPRAPQ